MPTWYASLRRQIPGIDPTNYDWRSLSQQSDELDSLAESIGVRHLLDFFGAPQAEMADLAGVPLDEAKPEDWFAAREGLVTVRALLKKLRSSPESVANARGAAQDLQELEQVLTAADREKVDFHISIDI